MTEQKAKEMSELARHVKPLHGFLVKRGVSPVDAWDIVQVAYIKVFNRQDTLPESSEKQKAILFAEVNVQMMAHFTEQRRLLGRAARARELVVFMGLTEQRDMSRVLEARQLLELILSELSPEQYQVFTEKVLDDLTIRKVAEHTGMNAHTTKTHWFRALETLREKLESIEHRGGRGLVVVLVIAGILGLANNASAMVERFKRFFRVLRQAHVHNLAGMAVAGAITLSPPNSSASAEHVSQLPRQTMSASTSGSVTQSDVVANSRVPGENATTAMPSVSTAMLPRLPLVIPRRNVPKQSAVKASSPDYLIAMAITALRDGQPEKTLTLLDQYAAVNVKATNSEVVKTLRADARAAIAGH